MEKQILDKVVLKGVNRIKKVYPYEEKLLTYDPVTGFENKKEWVFDTDGTNLREVVLIDGIDASRTVSNDICETLTFLGTEAARRALLDEMRRVISFDGSYVNYRHLALLADTMTHLGYLCAVTRHGINRRINSGPLMRASFEETVEILMEA